MCEHQMTREEIRDCMLRFGKCWTNPPKTEISEKHGYSFIPHGVRQPDMNDRAFMHFGKNY